jgi:hypothetical protein
LLDVGAEGKGVGVVFGPFFSVCEGGQGRRDGEGGRGEKASVQQRRKGPRENGRTNLVPLVKDRLDSIYSSHELFSGQASSAEVPVNERKAENDKQSKEEEEALVRKDEKQRKKTHASIP